MEFMICPPIDFVPSEILIEFFSGDWILQLSKLRDSVVVFAS